MSKKGLLKAEFNRVRTSTALKGNDMWTNTIGQTLDPQAGSNSVIEASIYAPTRGGGNRAERQVKAAQMVETAGYQTTVTDYKGLLTLAKAQGIGNETRGACKLCGCLGHLTRKCTNVLTGHTAASGMDVPGAVSGAGGTQVLGLLPEIGNISDLSDLSSSSSDSDSDSSSSSDSDRKRKRKHSSKEKRKKHKKEKSSSKDKKSSRDKKRHKHSKDKRSSKDKKGSKRSRHSDSD